MKKNSTQVNEQKAGNGLFVRLLQSVFVHNLALKGAALLLGVVTFIVLNIF